jgi:triphosphoribosyl-dephospho-CoA synthetase
LPTKLKNKFDVIFAWERRMAKSVAFQAIKPKPFSVWEVLIPVIFILNFMRSKEQREIFAQNLLFTKKLALEAAFDLIKKGHSRETVVDRIKKKTAGLLASITQDVYSEAIRQEQMKEMDLLIDHYAKLIQAEGEDYAELVVVAYHTREAYSNFLEKLKRAEEDVTRAARKTLGDQTDPGMVARIQAATEQIRQAEVDRIFS